MANFPLLSSIRAALFIIPSRLILISWRAIVKYSFSFKLLSSSTLKKGGLQITRPTFLASLTILICVSKLFNSIFLIAKSTASFWISIPVIGRLVRCDNSNGIAALLVPKSIICLTSLVMVQKLANKTVSKEKLNISFLWIIFILL